MQVFSFLMIIMKRGREIAAFFGPVKKKMGETNQSIGRSEGLGKGEAEAFFLFLSERKSKFFIF